MTTDEYLAAIHLALIENPIITSYRVVRQRATSQTGHLRTRGDLANGDFLEAAEPSYANGGIARQTIQNWTIFLTIVTMAARAKSFQVLL